MAAPPFRRMDSLRAATAGLQYLLVPGGRLLPLGRPAIAHRIRMGNCCTPRRLQSDVWQRVAMDIERLPSISGFFRGSLQRVFQPLVPYAQDAARRRLHDALAHDATRIQAI